MFALIARRRRQVGFDLLVQTSSGPAFWTTVSPLLGTRLDTLRITTTIIIYPFFFLLFGTSLLSAGLLFGFRLGIRDVLSARKSERGNHLKKDRV